MMAVAALASSHNIKSLDPIDKVTILTLKRYPLRSSFKADHLRLCQDGVTYPCAKGAESDPEIDQLLRGDCE
jgi:H+-transporting ATPase